MEKVVVVSKLTNKNEKQQTFFSNQKEPVLSSCVKCHSDSLHIDWVISDPLVLWKVDLNFVCKILIKQISILVLLMLELKNILR